MATGSIVTVLRLPDEKQLIGEANWRLFKCEILFVGQSRGLTSYMDNTIPKPILRAVNIMYNV